MKQFPKGFLWGAATASHQVEGNTYNDWSEWEKENAGRLAKEAEKKFGYLSNWDEIKTQAQNGGIGKKFTATIVSGISQKNYLSKANNHNLHDFSFS